MAGYVVFGSFMGDASVEQLLASDASPPLPFPVDDLFADVEGGLEVELGLPVRSHFLVDFDCWTFLNHGAFGCACRPAFLAAERWRRECERQPLAFLDRLLFPHLVASTRLLAAQLRARPQDCVLTANATAALSAVILGLPLRPGDGLFSLSIGYGSVKTMLRAAAERSGARHTELTVRFPLTTESLLAAVRDALPEDTKLAVFDAVTSNTALTLPVAQLARIVRERCPAARILIDGAHVLGAMTAPDVPALGVHYWVGNLHKHLCSPRGAAVLWAAPEVQPDCRPPVMSHGANSGFSSAFIWDGNRDYAPWLALPQTMRWWRALGEERAVAYMSSLLSRAVGTLLCAWQTHTLAPLSMCSNMALVRLPSDSLRVPAACAPAAVLAHASELLERSPPAAEGPATSADAKEWQDALFREAVESPVKCIQGVRAPHRSPVPHPSVALTPSPTHRQHLYVRITCHVYNCVVDYERLASVASLLCSRDGGKPGSVALGQLLSCCDRKL